MVVLALTTKAPVPHTPGHNTWWYIGLGIGFAIVVVVVIVTASILALAGRIGAQARRGIHLMDRARTTTMPVWQLEETNASLTAIAKAAESVRQSLQNAGAGGGR